MQPSPNWSILNENVANIRPTPPHLTSVLAEQLLARACENEADNAKRMRMGMEPVSQVTMTSTMMKSYASHSVEIQENSVTAGFSYKNFSADACASRGLASPNQPISV